MAKTPTPQPRRFAARQRRRLALGGIAAAASVTLTGCEDTPPTFTDAHFTSVSECTRAGFPDKLCDASYNAAWQDYFNTAPQFQSVAECEQEWGDQQCVQRSYEADPNAATGTGTSAGSVFVPLLAGFMVSQAMQQRYYRDGDRGFVYISGGSGFGGSPIYRNRSGSTVTLDGNAGPKAIARPVNVNTVTVSRSGFGGKGLSRGGFSG